MLHVLHVSNVLSVRCRPCQRGLGRPQDSSVNVPAARIPTGILQVLLLPELTINVCPSGYFGKLCQSIGWHRRITMQGPLQLAWPFCQRMLGAARHPKKLALDYNNYPKSQKPIYITLEPLPTPTYVFSGLQALIWRITVAILVAPQCSEDPTKNLDPSGDSSKQDVGSRSRPQRCFIDPSSQPSITMVQPKTGAWSFIKSRQCKSAGIVHRQLFSRLLSPPAVHGPAFDFRILKLYERFARAGLKLGHGE